MERRRNYRQCTQDTPGIATRSAHHELIWTHFAPPELGEVYPCTRHATFRQRRIVRRSTGIGVTGRHSFSHASVVSPEVLAREALSRQRLREQGAAMLAGTPGAAPRSPVSPGTGRTVPGVPAPIRGDEALKALGLYRRSVRSRPVLSGYTPQRTPRPVVFAYQAGQQLTKLSRTVSREWVEVLTAVSTTQVAGGKLSGAQGRNLIRIVETLRKHCYLKLDTSGRPLQTREQVLEVVDGEGFCFARECGMSEATFYRALKHPLAHLFLRTQKVQRVDPGTQARRNVATLFSVALYEPLMPMELELAFWAESVGQVGEFLVPDFNPQSEGTKGSPLNYSKTDGGLWKTHSPAGGASWWLGRQ